MEKEFEVKGWKAVAILAAIVLFSGYTFISAKRSLDTDGKQVVKDWIISEYQRYHLARTDISDEERAELLLQSRDLEIKSMSARGNLDSMIVRVEIEPNAAHPDNMDYVQYYKLRYSKLTGWEHVFNVGPFSYYTAFF